MTSRVCYKLHSCTSVILTAAVVRDTTELPLSRPEYACRTRLQYVALCVKGTPIQSWLAGMPHHVLHAEIHSFEADALAAAPASAKAIRAAVPVMRVNTMSRPSTMQTLPVSHDCTICTG